MCFGHRASSHAALLETCQQAGLRGRPPSLVILIYSYNNIIIIRANQAGHSNARESIATTVNPVQGTFAPWFARPETNIQLPRFPFSALYHFGKLSRPQPSRSRQVGLRESWERRVATRPIHRGSGGLGPKDPARQAHPSIMPPAVELSSRGTGLKESLVHCRPRQPI